MEPCLSQAGQELGEDLPPNQLPLICQVDNQQAQPLPQVLTGLELRMVGNISQDTGSSRCVFSGELREEHGSLNDEAVTDCRIFQGSEMKLQLGEFPLVYQHLEQLLSEEEVEGVLPEDEGEEGQASQPPLSQFSVAAVTAILSYLIPKP